MAKRAGCGALAMLVALLSTGSAAAERMCLHVARDGSPGEHVQIFSGDKLIIRFSHSLYRSAVEEEFHLLPTGFRSSQLRYGELRLVEFYGHESSRPENGFWVVEPQGTDLKSLDLHTDSDTPVKIVLGNRVVSSLGASTAHRRARLFVSVCPVHKDD